MESGTEILYRSPPDPSVWYAPETLLWYAVLLGGPLLVVLALKPLIFRVLDYLAGRAPGEQPSDLDATQRRIVLTLPEFRSTVLAFCCAVMLFNACLGATWKLAQRVPHEDAMLVNTSPGLPAAAAFLTPLAICLFVMTLASLAVAAHYAAALLGTSLMSVIWAFAGGAGCLVAAFVAAAGGAGPYASLPWVGLGLGLLGYGIWLRQARSSRGQPSILERARRAEQLLHRAQAEAALGAAPPCGEYRGRSALLYWGRIVGMFLLPPAFFLGSFLFFEHSGFRGAAHALRDPNFFLFAFAAGGFFALIAWLPTARHARLVTWDEQGLEVVWYRGHPKRLGWDELRSLKVLDIEGGTSGALVTTTSGDRLNLLSGRAGYSELLAALEVRIWGREEPAGQA